MSQLNPGAKAKSDPYHAIAEFYDLEHDQFTNDLDLIRHLVETVGDPVLELGCGSGRVLAHLAGLDMRLTGVDTSAAMLERASYRIGANDKIDLTEADMAATPLPDDTFGTVILALNGLLHATTSSTQRAVLAEAHRVLDPRGLLFLDVPNPHAGVFDFSDHGVVREGAWTLPDGSEVSKFSSRTIHRADQTVSTSIWYDVTQADRSVHRHATSFDLRYIYPSELLLMLELAGFVEWQTYGTYDLDPFVDMSPRLIVTAEKTPSR